METFLKIENIKLWARVGVLDQEFNLSKIKIILTKCNPPITGFDGKVSIVRILENN